MHENLKSILPTKMENNNYRKQQLNYRVTESLPSENFSHIDFKSQSKISCPLKTVKTLKITNNKYFPAFYSKK